MRLVAALSLALGACLLPAQGAPADCARVLQQLDQAFDRHDADAYLAAFAWESRGLQKACADRLREVFRCQCEPCLHPLQRRSTLVGGLRSLGEHRIALVRSEFHRGTGTVTAVEHSYLAFRSRDAAMRPVLQIEVSEAVRDHVQGERFTCTACDYAIGGAPGWLCVPLQAARADAFEAVTFLRLGHDLACDVSVHLDGKPQPAAAAIAQVTQGLRRLLPALQEEAVLPWLPAALQRQPSRPPADAPGAPTGARQRLLLPDGTCSEVHVLCQDRLRHLLVVRGTPGVLAERRADIDALLATFALLDPTADRLTLAARALAAHQGGRLTACGFEHDGHAFAVDAPPGWVGEQKAGGTAFQVVFRCPQGDGRMWVTGHALPPGLPRFCTADADRLLADLCRRSGLAVADAPDAGWHDGPADTNYRVRDAVLRPLQPKPGEPAERHLRLVWRPDLLVVLDGWVCGKAEPRVLQRAFASLRRL